MKKVFTYIFLMLFCMSLVSCSQAGKTDNVKVNIGQSVKFSKEEINSAVDCVKKKFRSFDGCDLKKLWYDEDNANSTIEEYLRCGHGSVNGIKAENVIVLLSDFYVDSSGGPNECMNPNSPYNNWGWILTRRSKSSSWKVDDWGY